MSKLENLIKQRWALALKMEDAEIEELFPMAFRLNVISYEIYLLRQKQNGIGKGKLTRFGTQ